MILDIILENAPSQIPNSAPIEFGCICFNKSTLVDNTLQFFICLLCNLFTDK